jgi:hypothetical protein
MCGRLCRVTASGRGPSLKGGGVDATTLASSSGGTSTPRSMLRLASFGAMPPLRSYTSPWEGFRRPCVKSGTGCRANVEREKDQHGCASQVELGERHTHAMRDGWALQVPNIQFMLSCCSVICSFHADCVTPYGLQRAVHVRAAAACRPSGVKDCRLARRNASFPPLPNSPTAP